MNPYLEVLLRTLLAIAVLLLLARLDGSKQISQLTFYDYIVGISAGSIAASMCIELDVDIWYAIIGISLFMLSSLLLSILTNKSIVMRRVLTGTPIFLMAGGKILYDGLKHAHFDVNDLMRELRVAGYFDINEVNYAILETNGTVSVMPNPDARPAKTAEQGMTLPEESLSANVVIDGKIVKGNLSAMDKTADWLHAELDRQQLHIKNVALATLNTDGNLSVYLKETGKGLRTILQ